MAKRNRNARELLKGIGVGDFNATMIIQYMFVAPATTDPRSSPIIIMVQHIQRALNAMGAGIPVSGYLDKPTAAALYRVVGPNWERISWAQNITAIIDGADVDFSAAPELPLEPMPQAIGGPLDFLPDVPGGIFTYAAGAYLLWRHFARK